MHKNIVIQVLVTGGAVRAVVDCRNFSFFSSKLSLELKQSAVRRDIQQTIEGNFIHDLRQQQQRDINDTNYFDLTFLSSSALRRCFIRGLRGGRLWLLVRPRTNSPTIQRTGNRLNQRKRAHAHTERQTNTDTHKNTRAHTHAYAHTQVFFLLKPLSRLGRHPGDPSLAPTDLLCL